MSFRILMLFNKHGLKSFVLLVLILLLSQKADAQLVTGFKANGKLVLQGDTVNICVGSTIKYESTAQGFNMLNWRFNNGSPTTGNSTLQTILYPTAGIDSTWQIIVQGNDRDSMYVIVRVNNTKPLAGFTFAPDGECGNVPVLFTNLSSGTGLSYLWDFGDLITSTASNPSHQFLAATGSSGIQPYSIKLVVTNDQVCKDSITKVVTVRKIPDASLGNGRSPEVIFGAFNGDQTFRRCENTPFYEFRFINASNTTAIISQYKIQWGDGTPDAVFSTWPAGTLNHTYPRGKSIMTVTAQGTNGCVGIKTYNVFLGTTPAAGYASPGNTSICAPNLLQFIITGYANNALGTTYQVTTSDGSLPDNYQHPPPDTVNHIFTIGSCGIVSNVYNNAFSSTLFVENPCGSTTVSVVPIYVSGKPRANLSFSPSSNVCINSAVIISNTTAYGGQITPTGGTSSTCVNIGRQVWKITPATGYTITAGSLGSVNGNAANGSVWTVGTPSLNAIFTVPGIYSVKIYVSNDLCGVDSITKTICVRLPPTASFTMDKHEGCAPDTLTITNASPIGTCLGETYSWAVAYQDAQNCGVTPNYSFIGGTGTTTRDAKIRFVNPGRYIVSLTETAIASGCPSPVFRDTFYVKAKPRVTINTLTAVCISNPISPTATVTACYSSQALIYNWTFANGTPASANTLIPGSVQYSAVGNYPVTLSVENECGITTANATASITNVPVANAGPDKSFCSGTSTTIGINTGNYTYSWSPATGLSNPNIGVPTVTRTYNGLNADTVFTYILTVAAGANCSSMDTVNVTVKKSPVITVTPATAAICSGTSIVLVASGAVTYFWPPGSTLNTTTGDTVIATPTANTTYTVTGTLNGCSANGQATVTVTTVATPDAGPNISFCNFSTSVQLVGTPPGGVWSGHPNLTPGGIFNPNAAGNGTYKVYYTVTSGICSKKDSALITVTNGDTARAGADLNICQQSGTMQLNGTPSGGIWSGSPLVTGTGIFNTNTPGTYTLIYVIGSGSCISRDTVIITVNNGITNNVISANQALCFGAQPAQITGQSVNGGNGTPTYQWQQSTDSLTWTNINGATGQNYLPPVVTQVIFYRRVASTILCSGAQSNMSLPVKITINPDALAVFNPTDTVGCVPFNITQAVINLTPFNNAVIQYFWYVNGNLWSPNQAFPTYTMNTPGDTATIKLAAISRFGCKNDSVQHGFKTIARPAPAFTQSDSVGCGPLNITFTNQTPNAALYTYQWIFGTGATSTLQQPGPVNFPTHPQGGDTVYTVKFITISQCNRDTLIRYVRVKSKPKVLFTPDRTTGCSSYNFTFTNTSRSSGTTTYVWDFGDGSPLLPSNAAQVNHMYTVGITTTFRVKLKATNECGTDSLIYNLVVTPITIRPDFAINGNQQFGCLPHTVQFINNSQGATLYSLNFGDGSPIVSGFNGVDTITHTYTTAGTFTATLRGTNSCSDTMDVEIITVQSKPAVSFTASSVLACTADTIRFTNLSDTGISYNWRFGDGSTALIRNPTHIYTTGNTFRVWLTGTKVYAGGSCADSAFKDIVIRDTLPGSFTAGTLAATCLPVSISFVNDNRPAAFTSWTFGDGGTGTGDSVNHTYTQAGTYTVKMVSKGIAGCTYSSTKTITVTGLSGTLLYNSGYLCPGIPLRMEVQSPNAPQIRYIFGNGDSLTTTNTIINYTYPQPGIYVPYAYIISPNCQLRLQVGDTVKVDRLRTGFRTQIQQSCGSTTISFTDTSNAFFGIRSRLWSFGDGTTSTLQNPVHTYTQSGTYSVRLRITGNSNCVDTITISVTVSIRNFPVSSIGGDTLACISQPLALSAIVQSTDPITGYNWDFGNGTGGASQNINAVYNNVGTYTVRLISRTAFGCADTVYKTVRVDNTPIVNAGPDVTICRGQSIQIGATGATVWQWSPLQGLSCTTCANLVASPLVTTSYVVTGSFGALCRANDTIRVQVIQPFNMTVSPTTTLCIGDSVPLFATGAYTYSWSPAVSLNNANISNPIAKPTATTLYQVVGKDNFNCFTDTDYVRVNVGQYPTVDLGTGATVTAGTVITLNPTITNGPITRYRWTPPTDLSCANCPRPAATINRNISYKLEVENAFGCIGSDTINFRVNCDPNQLFIPNGFSPDGDGTNDILMVRGKGISVVKYFRIFNRWGQLVFERSDINVNDAQQGWDGRINGVPAQPDVYVYTAEAVCTAGETFVYKGNVTLVR